MSYEGFVIPRKIIIRNCLKHRQTVNVFCENEQDEECELWIY
jgi:hypothetical protein